MNHSLNFKITPINTPWTGFGPSIGGVRKTVPAKVECAFRLLLFFLTFLSLFAFTKVFGQKPESNTKTLDSLLLLPISKVKIDALNKFSFDTRNSDSASSWKAANQAFQIATKLKDEDGIASSYWGMGYKKRISRKFDEALKFFQDGLAIQEKLEHKKQIADFLDQIAFVYRDIGPNETYLLYFDNLKMALKVREELGDSGELAKSYLNIANSLNGWGFYIEALYEHRETSEYLKMFEMLDYIKKIGNQMGISPPIIETGDSAIYYYKLSRDYFQGNGDSSEFAKLNNYLALGYMKKKDYDSAIIYLKEAMQINLQTGDSSSLGITYFNLGIVYYKKGDYNEALAYLDESEKIATRFEYSNLRENVLFYKRKALEEKTDFDTALKNGLKQQKDKLFLFIIITIFLVITIALMILLILVRRGSRKRRNIILENARIHGREINELLKKEEMQSFLAMLEGQEQERKRIAKDLHDRLGSKLSSIKLYFSAIEEEMKHLNIFVSKQFPRALNLLDEACDEVRKISYNLESGNIVQFGLVAALTDLSDTVTGTGKVKMKIVTQNMSERLPLKLEVSIYNIIQELVSNVLKHAEAKELNIQFVKYYDRLNIMVEDDGKGIKEPKRGIRQREKEQGGMGMRNIQDRVEKISGHIVYDPGKGKGTTVILDIPLTDEA